MDHAALEKREASVQSEEDIDSALLAHVAGKYYGPHFADRIRQFGISPQVLSPAILRQTPAASAALRQLRDDQHLWFVVSAAWIYLLRLNDKHVARHMDALNERLAAAEAALQDTAPTSGPNRIIHFLTTGEYVPPQPSALCVIENSFPMHVTTQEFYYRRRADVFGIDAERYNDGVCSFLGCVREWSARTTIRHVSEPIYNANAWQTFFCDEHLHIMAQRPRATYDLCCNTCGVEPPAHIIVELCRGKQLPLCAACRDTPYVRRQLAVYIKRYRFPPADAGSRIVIDLDSETEDDAADD
jgi:hypothetical protein